MEVICKAWPCSVGCTSTCFIPPLPLTDILQRDIEHRANRRGTKPLYNVKPSVLEKEEERHNREVSQELFEVIKLCWKDEPFSFTGKYYKAPNPL